MPWGLLLFCDLPLCIFSTTNPSVPDIPAPIERKLHSKTLNIAGSSSISLLICLTQVALVQHLDMNRVLSAGSTSWWPCSSMRISLSTVIFSIFRPCHPIITLVLKTFIFTEQFWVRLAIYTHVSDDLHHSRCDFHLRSNFIQEHLPECAIILLLGLHCKHLFIDDIPEMPRTHGLTRIGYSSSRVLCGYILNTCFVMTFRLFSTV